MNDVKVDFLQKDNSTVVIVEEEAYHLNEGEVEFHITDDGVIAVTHDDYYLLERDENDWYIVTEDVPECVLEELDNANERYADAEAEGWPVEFEVGVRTNNTIYNSSWQQEKIRPSSEVGRLLDNCLDEIQLEVSVEEHGEVTITDLDLWGESKNVSIDI